jgi:uncharacterized zinc-type alcohol dehydrogenase-like protein
MQTAQRRFDFILDTIPVGHRLDLYLPLLWPEGTLVLVGPVEPMPETYSTLLLSGAKMLAGLGIGGIVENQELLDFCAEHQILPQTEVIAVQDINHASSGWRKAASSTAS